MTVLTRVTASAPPSAAASAMATRSVTFGLNLAHRGRPHPAVAAITARVALAEWANMLVLASMFGHDRLTSTATTAGGASARSRAAASYSATVRPQMLTTTRAPVSSRGGRSAASHAGTPGP